MTAKPLTYAQVRATPGDSAGDPGVVERPHQAWTLAELQERPELLAPPELALARFAWRQRVTLFAAREKLGKSTTIAHAVGKRTRGTWCLGEIVPTPGRCLWIYFEGHPGDVVRNLTTAKAEPESVIIAQGEPGRPDRLRSLLDAYRPAVVVVDALSSYAVGLVNDSFRAEQWTPIMNLFGTLAQEFDTAIVLIHHATKSGSGYADSRAIGAGADMIIEMEGTAGEATPRKVKGVGRWPYAGFSIRMDGDELFLVDAGDVGVDALVLDFVQKNPGCGSGKLRSNIDKRSEDVDAAVRRLIAKGLLRDDGSRRPDGTIDKHRYNVGAAPADPCPEPPKNPPAGQGSGQGGLSHRKTLSDKAVTESRTTPLSLVPDTSIGTGQEPGTGTDGAQLFPCVGAVSYSCEQTFHAAGVTCGRCHTRIASDTRVASNVAAYDAEEDNE